VLAGDSDADGDMLAVIKVSDPAHGTLTLNSNGSFVYTPTTDYFGTDQFTYKLTDGKAFSAPATVTLTVIPQANRAPSAMGDSYTTDEDTLLRVLAPGVLGNDSDLDGNLLTAQLITPPTHGTLALNPGTGYFTYQPYPNYHGSDSFTYKANDGHLDSDSVTVNLTVNSVNDVPVAVDDSYTMSVVDSFFTIEAAQLLANDFDLDNVAVPDSQTITAHLVVGGGPNHGYADIDDDGILSYIPEDGFTGTDTFTYHIFDGVAYSAPATVTITVTPKGGAAPQVESFIINDGSAQRSMVTSTTVTFNTKVTIDSGAFQIVNRTTSAAVTGWTTTTTVDSAGKTVVVFNFPSAAGFVGGSLADGNYRFTIAADKVHAGSFNLDGDGDGTDSDDFVFGAGDADKFFRFFGDTDGDRDVDGADLNQLKKSLNKQSGDPGYLWFLDYDSDGDVQKGGTGNQDDYAQFLQNFRKRNL
jgi:hypothetical protein